MKYTSIKDFKAKLISITPRAEKTMAYIARVSSPKSITEKYQDPEKLLKYCAKHGHWSVFEHAHMTLEIWAPKSITIQMLRHRSFTFSEFSQRYSKVPPVFYLSDVRFQHPTNRQSSEEMDPNSEMERELNEDWLHHQEQIFSGMADLYDMYVELGLAKEVARNILPVSVMSTIYMTGSIRSWIHYIKARTYEGAQKEHQHVAQLCKKILLKKCPTLKEVLG